MSDFFAMGGYGFYVWTSYALVFSGLCALIIYSKLAHQSLIKTLKQKYEAKN